MRTGEEQTDKQFTELLQELRVVQTGVQILSGLLLTLPFTSRGGAHDARVSERSTPSLWWPPHRRPPS